MHNEVWGCTEILPLIYTTLCIFFPMIFEGVSKRVSRGSVGGQLTGGQCFVEAPFNCIK